MRRTPDRRNDPISGNSRSGPVRSDGLVPLARRPLKMLTHAAARDSAEGPGGVPAQRGPERPEGTQERAARGDRRCCEDTTASSINGIS
jgi:hypothetical protein